MKEIVAKSYLQTPREAGRIDEKFSHLFDKNYKAHVVDY
jgi:hypothetical protein